MVQAHIDIHQEGPQDPLLASNHLPVWHTTFVCNNLFERAKRYEYMDVMHVCVCGWGWVQLSFAFSRFKLARVRTYVRTYARYDSSTISRIDSLSGRRFGISGHAGWPGQAGPLDR